MVPIILIMLYIISLLLILILIYLDFCGQNSDCQYRGHRFGLCHRPWATESVHHNSWATHPRAHASQQRSHCSEKSVRCDQRVAPLTVTRGSPRSSKDPTKPKIYWLNTNFLKPWLITFWLPSSNSSFPLPPDSGKLKLISFSLNLLVSEI